MTRLIRIPAIRTTVAVSCVLFLPCADSFASTQAFPQAAPQAVLPQLLAPDQLDNLVAPIALYPDPLLSQVLAASTYPLEIVEAQQWLQQNRYLRGRPLIEAAKQQNWDPSVQLLVAFPDPLALLNRDIRWTTDLGNAFLAQQADVMNAIQRLRFQATSNGRLATTPQQIVSTATQNGQSAIQIQPANPQVLYPPVYNPAYVWGPPVSGAYPALWFSQSGYGSGFGSGISLAGLFSGLLGWQGWGWILSWFTHTLSLSSLFFNLLGLGSSNFASGFNSTGGFGGSAVWAHDPAHRLGVPYSNGFLAARYRGGARLSSPRLLTSSVVASGRSASDGWRHFGVGNPAFTSRAGGPGYRSGFASSSSASPQSYRSYASAMPQRMASGFRSPALSPRTPAPVSHAATPRPSSLHFSSRTSSKPPHISSPKVSSPHFSKPRGSSHVSAPRHSGGGHSSKGSRKH